ncbi:hypothetical protein J132_04359 [Termitomyces sp. J132]|nr:hypothetical protein J132_04359 [Termitomyces sp. J132]
MLSLFLTQTDPVGKPKPKKIKVLPVFANLKPGSEAVLSLLSQVDTILKAIQLADNGALLPCADLQQHCDAVDLAMQQQLYLLNITVTTRSPKPRTSSIKPPNPQKDPQCSTELPPMPCAYFG